MSDDSLTKLNSGTYLFTVTYSGIIRVENDMTEVGIDDLMDCSTVTLQDWKIKKTA